MSAQTPGSGRFVVPALVLAGFIGVVAVWMSRPEPRPEPETAVSPSPGRPPGIVASRPLGMASGPVTQVAELAIDGRSGKWSVTGELGSDEERDKVMAAATSGLGPDWSGEIVVSDGTLSAPWIGGLQQALTGLRDLPVRVTFAGETVTIQGEASSDIRQKVLKTLVAAWGSRILVVWREPAGMDQ